MKRSWPDEYKNKKENNVVKNIAASNPIINIHIMFVWLRKLSTKQNSQIVPTVLLEQD